MRPSSFLWKIEIFVCSQFLGGRSEWIEYARYHLKWFYSSTWGMSSLFTLKRG